MLQFKRVREGRVGGGGAGCDQRRQLLTGKIVLKWSKEVTDDWHTPCLPQHLLPLLPVHVPYIGVMFGEAKDSVEELIMWHVYFKQNLLLIKKDSLTVCSW